MARNRVERSLLVVELDAVSTAVFTVSADFMDRRDIRLAQRFGFYEFETFGPPFHDVAQVGKGDAGVFLQHPLDRNAEASRPCRYLFKTCRFGRAIFRGEALGAPAAGTRYRSGTPPPR